MRPLDLTPEFLRQQIAKNETTIAQNALAFSERNGGWEFRPVKNESMKLAVLAARIGCCRQCLQECPVISSARKTRVENLGIHAAQNGLEVQGQKRLIRLERILFGGWRGF